METLILHKKLLSQKRKSNEELIRIERLKSIIKE